jgi:hypothetical protein
MTEAVPRYDPEFLKIFTIVCGALSFYISSETLVLAFTLFHRYNTLYFWAIVGCASGCILFAGGFMDLFFKMYLVDGLGSDIYRPLFILTIGWYLMVTGFALVLWSRLHIVSVSKWIIRYLKYFIIYNVIFSHFPTTVLTFGDNVVRSPEFILGYSIMEKIQVTMFCIQEATMSVLYIYFTLKLTQEKELTKTVIQSLFFNAVVFGLDIAVVSCEYAGLYEIQIMLKVVVYSIKLKLEFLILTLLAKNYEHLSKAKTVHHQDHAVGNENNKIGSLQVSNSVAKVMTTVSVAMATKPADDDDEENAGAKA